MRQNTLSVSVTQLKASEKSVGKIQDNKRFHHFPTILNVLEVDVRKNLRSPFHGFFLIKGKYVQLDVNYKTTIAGISFELGQRSQRAMAASHASQHGEPCESQSY